jgi:chromosome partitioning protein
MAAEEDEAIADGADLLQVTAADVRSKSRPTYVQPIQDPDIVTVAAFKGGTGKSRLAKELASALDAVLTDFEWDKGSNTRAWGWREEERQKSPLLEAFRTGKTPRPLSGGGRKPDLIPAHTDFGLVQPGADDVADALTQWTADLKRRLVVDTHPGGCGSTFGAMAAARVTVVPVVLGVDELNALEGMLAELSDYPLLLIPYMLDRVPQAWAIARLAELQKRFGVTIGPKVGNYRWIKDRQNRVPICASAPSKRSQRFIEEILEVAVAVDQYGR